ncbi:MAG: family 10 glycosylhydrolase [Pirellulales bacterium]
MTGHARPSSLALALARATLVVCAVLSLSAVGQEVAQPPQITPADEPVQLSISWGGGAATAWLGEMRLDRGAFSDLQLIDGSADLAGSVWLDRADLHIRSLSAHTADNVNVVASASPDAKITIRLAAGPQAAVFQAEVPLADLAKKPYQAKLDEHGNSLEVRAVPAPPIRINLRNRANDGGSLTMAPGSQLAFEAVPNLPPNLHGTTLDVQTTLTPARRKDTVWRSEPQRLAVPVNGYAKADLVVPLNVGDGVYTVHVNISRPSGYFRDKFFPGAAASIAERSFQVVVLDPHPPAATGPGKWDTVLEIDPTNPKWIERLPTWTRQLRIPLINNINLGMLGSLRAGAVNLPLGRFVELPATVAGADAHWQAYSLPLEASGTPHLLEIEYPSDEEQHFGLSIVEPNAAGVIEGVQRDAGVYVEGLGRSEAQRVEKHRLVFWPRTQSPLLLVTNQHPTAPAHFGQIRVLKRVGPLNDDNPKLPPTERLVAAYVSQPLVAESLGAWQTVAPAMNGATRAVADSQTQFESATRLAEYVRHGGYNSAVVAVCADGKSVYPSEYLPSTNFNGSGIADSIGPCDALELMLQTFDRERLTLIPSIEFAIPLPHLEELRRTSESQSSGLELIGANGRTWLEVNGPGDGRAPYYNVLEPRVQDAMLAVVTEIVQRYGRHPSFGGVAIQLTSNGYTQLPPLDWGLDDATVERFAQDTGVRIAGPGPNRFAARAAALAGPNADAWRSWRTQQIAMFYSRMASAVSEGGTRKLLLTTEQLFAHPQIRDRVRPSLMVENRVATTMLDLGLDRSRLEQTPGLFLCPTNYVEPMSPLADRAIDLELNAAYARWNSPDAPSSGGGVAASVIYHPPQLFRVAAFDKASPYRIAGELQQHSEPQPSGAAARQAYVQAMLQGDPAVILDGGATLPLGHERLLHDVRAVIAQLPRSAQVASIARQAVVARTYSDMSQTTILIMNTTPWRAESQVVIEAVEAVTLAPLAGAGDKRDTDANQPTRLAAGRQTWPLSLSPFELRAVRVIGTGAKIVDVQATLSDVAQAELKTRIGELAARDLSAPHEYRKLVNPGFEPMAGAGPLPGWRLSSSSKTATAVLDAQSPQEGKTSLYIRNDQGFATLESEPFAVPPTGQLAMTVFARGQNLGPTSELHLVFESVAGGQTYWRGAAVKAEQIQRQGQQWAKPFAISVNDLPLDTRGQMHIRFELSGPGEVWLDNVKLNDLLFPLTYYAESRPEGLKLLRRTHAPQTAYEAGEYKDCLDLLDGYWPRFVLAYTQPPVPAVATRPATPAVPPSAGSPPTAEKTDEAAPGLSERIKRMVPILR